MPVSSDKTAFVITRSLPLPRAVMWKAWSESDQLEHQRTLCLVLEAVPRAGCATDRRPFQEQSAVLAAHAVQR